MTGHTGTQLMAPTRPQLPPVLGRPAVHQLPIKQMCHKPERPAGAQLFLGRKENGIRLNSHVKIALISSNLG